jgi:hypothetical protein
MKMLGIVLLVVGVICLAVPSITFFTREQVADVGFFEINMEKPHTIFLNPIVGIIAMVAGGALLMFGGRRAEV